MIYTHVYVSQDSMLYTLAAMTQSIFKKTLVETINAHAYVTRISYDVMC